jgi:hypothetical protein
MEQVKARELYSSKTQKEPIFNRTIREYTKKQLQDEINATEQMIEFCASGVRDLIYRDKLYYEAEQRGYEIIPNNKIKLK